MLKNLRNYILENDFKVTVFNNKVDVLNYLVIDHFDDTKIILRYDKGILVINGSDLIISKLLDDELLINGKVKNIEFK